MSDRPSDSRRRSRSPERHSSRRHHREQREHGERSERHHHKRRRTTPPPTAAAEPILLPYNSRQLSKRDLSVFRPMFALYLDIQKGKDMEELGEEEVKGRWKSFIGKWNRRELAEGWYDPSTLQKAIASAEEHGDREPERERRDAKREERPVKGEKKEDRRSVRDDDDDDSDDSMGPALPGHEKRQRRAGPSIPNTTDLELKREMDLEDNQARHEDLRYERKADRKSQKEALDELVPRAEPGTRERQLEKKAAVNEVMRSFREKSPGGEVPDAEMMGGGDGIGEYKKAKEVFERKKNERELRKEEFLRARNAEREERLGAYREKEEGTMAMLRALAKQRFGAE